MARTLKKLPKFASWEQEEKFWETHSTADYVFEDVPPEEHLLIVISSDSPSRKAKTRQTRKRGTSV